VLLVFGDGFLYVLIVFLLAFAAIPAAVLFLSNVQHGVMPKRWVTAVLYAAGVWLAATMIGGALPPVFDSRYLLAFFGGGAATLWLARRSGYGWEPKGLLTLLLVGPPGTVVIFNSTALPSLGTAWSAQAPMTRPTRNAFVVLIFSAVVAFQERYQAQATSGSLTIGVLEFLIFAGLAVWLRQSRSRVAPVAGAVVLALDLVLVLMSESSPLLPLILRIVLFAALVRSSIEMWRAPATPVSPAVR